MTQPAVCFAPPLEEAALKADFTLLLQDDLE